MKASKFSEAQITFVLKQAEDGSVFAEVGCYGEDQPIRMTHSETEHLLLKGEFH